MALKKTLNAAMELLVVAICTIALAFTIAGIFVSVLGRNAAGAHDLVEYWASGQLLVHHEDPYSASLILPLERSVNFPAGLPPLIMGNPPWSLPLVVPLGFLDAKTADLLWLVVSCACLVASIRMVWRMHGSPKTPLNILAYTFAPALSCLLAGQVTIFVLFGLVLFLRFHQTRPFLAGGALWLCLLKPHLFLPFGVVLLLWMIVQRSYKVLAGSCVALCASMATATSLDGSVWQHYGQMMRTARLDRGVLPSLSFLLRENVWPHTLWVQCIPAAIGCVWALFYFRRHRGEWNWLEHGSLVMLVSVLVAPYTWLMDQAVLIPALLHGIYATRSRNLIAVLGLGSAAIEIGALLGLRLLHSNFYLWTSPVWLIWYLFATRRETAGTLDSRVGAGVGVESA